MVKQQRGRKAQADTVTRDEFNWLLNQGGYSEEDIDNMSVADARLRIKNQTVKPAPAPAPEPSNDELLAARAQIDQQLAERQFASGERTVEPEPVPVPVYMGPSLETIRAAVREEAGKAAHDAGEEIGGKIAADMPAMVREEVQRQSPPPPPAQPPIRYDSVPREEHHESRGGFIHWDVIATIGLTILLIVGLWWLNDRGAFRFLWSNQPVATQHQVGDVYPASDGTQMRVTAVDSNGNVVSAVPVNPETSPGASSEPSTAPQTNNPMVVPAGNGDLSVAYQSGSVGSTEFCKALGYNADINQPGAIGGPSLKWWGTQNPDGTSVANSCVLREADDRDFIGWEVTLPANTVSHIWLVDPDKPNIHVAVTAVGPGEVRSPYLASRMTVYFATAPISAGHEGQWTYGIWAGTDSPACGWVSINQSVTVCDIGTNQSADRTNPNNPGANNQPDGNRNACTLSRVRQAVVSGNVRVKQSIKDSQDRFVGAVFIVTNGGKATFRAGHGLVVVSSTGTHNSGDVKAGEASVYCK